MEAHVAVMVTGCALSAIGALVWTLVGLAARPSHSTLRTLASLCNPRAASGHHPHHSPYGGGRAVRPSIV